MLRFAIWLLIIFMIVKIVRLFLNWKQYGGSDDQHAERSQPPIPPFDNVQDADFEDITPTSPSPESKQPPS